MILNQKIGLKPGSKNLVMATDSRVTAKTNCIAEHKKASGEPISYDISNPDNINSVYPLSRGIMSSKIDAILFANILATMDIPQETHLVVATPETELESGRMLLENTIIKVLNPKLLPMERNGNIENRLVMFPESLCGAISKLGVDEAMNKFITIINMGSTTTGFGVFNSGTKLLLTSFTETSGKVVDENIYNRLKNTYGTPLTDLNKVERLKNNFSFRNKDIFSIDILSKDGKKNIDCYQEIYTSLDEYAKKVADLFISVIPTDSATAYHILNNQIILTGGMSNIPDINSKIKAYIEEKIGMAIDIITVRNGESAPAIGAYLLAKELF